MTIYNRDNIPYQSMIDSMIRNRAEKGKIMGDNWRKQGEIWGGFAKDTGALAGRTMDALQAQEESPENILKKLEEELAEAKAYEKWNTRPTALNQLADDVVADKARRDAMGQMELSRTVNDYKDYNPAYVPQDNYAMAHAYDNNYFAPNNYSALMEVYRRRR